MESGQGGVRRGALVLLLFLGTDAPTPEICYVEVDFATAELLVVTAERCPLTDGEEVPVVVYKSAADLARCPIVMVRRRTVDLAIEQQCSQRASSRKAW